MPSRPARAARTDRPTRAGNALAARPDANAVLARLLALADPKVLAGYARYGIVVERAHGIAMSRLHALAKELGPRHDLCAPLWKSGVYEARLLVAFVGEPARLTPAQMERWCRTFDNWAVVDTLCFKLFDRSPHAWAMIAAWKDREPEFEKRAAFALLASLALHDRDSGDAPFRAALAWIEAAATDPRNFVKKGVLWALRGIGTRNALLRTAALAKAQRLAKSTDATARWIGTSATRELGRRAPRA